MLATRAALQRVVARSLSEAFAVRSQLTALHLVASPDCKCINIMCGKVGGACVCRIAMSVGRSPTLEEVVLSRNAINVLPDVLWSLPSLTSLNVAQNALTALPPALATAPQLRHIDVSDNPLTTPCANVLASCAPLRELRWSLSDSFLSSLAPKQRLAVTSCRDAAVDALAHTRPDVHVQLE